MISGWVRAGEGPWDEAGVDLAGTALRVHRPGHPQPRLSVELDLVVGLDEIGPTGGTTSHLELRLRNGAVLELGVPTSCRDELVAALRTTAAAPATASSPAPSSTPTSLAAPGPASPPPLPPWLHVPRQALPAVLDLYAAPRRASVDLRDPTAPPTEPATSSAPTPPSAPAPSSAPDAPPTTSEPEPHRPSDDALPAAPVARWGPPVLPGAGQPAGESWGRSGSVPGAGSARAGHRRRAPHRPARHTRHPMRWALAIAVLAMTLVGADLVAVHLRIDRFDAELPGADDGVRTWLLVGTDSRAAATGMPNPEAFGSAEEVPGERADVVLLVQEGRDDQPPRVVSVPRDLLVFRRDHGVDRLALSLLDGPSGLVTSICRSLGVPVDHVVRIRFDGLRDLVDLVDGIEVELDQPARDEHTGLDLDEGTSRLDGAGAIAWMRSRHLQRFDGTAWITDPSSDTGRQERQREVLEQVTARMARMVRNPLDAHRLAWTASGAIATDSGTGPFDLARLATTLRSAETRESLPHSLLDGRIPVATLTSDAQGMLDGLRSGVPDGPPCPRPQVASP